MLLINHPSSFFGPASSKVAFPLSGFGDVTLSLYRTSSSKFVFVIIIILSPFKMIGELPDYVIQYLLSYLVRSD